MPDFKKLSAAIDDGISRRLHTGIQIYISLGGDVLLDAGFGLAGRDQPMTAESLMLWRSAGKPLTALLALQRCEAGHLSLDAPLAEALPQFENRPVGQITLTEVLTHTTGIPLIETGWPQSSWTEILTRVEAAARERSPGVAAYQPQSTWFLLGDVLCGLDSQRRDFATILRQDLMKPLGLNDTGCGVSTETIAELGDRMPMLYCRDRGQLVESNHARSRWITQPSPGGNWRGPVRALGRFYEALLRHGQLSDGTQFVSADTVSLMTARHRVNEFDMTLQHVVDFGLGIIVDSNHHGADTVPYGFGRYCSPTTFGHGGAQCAMGFCDPVSELVVAWAANGFCGEGLHQRRNRAINEAVYEDLGLGEDN